MSGVQKKKRLYVWESPYGVSYGHSMVFSIARNLEEAKKVANSKFAKRYCFGYEQDGDGGLCDLGEPTRVVDLPCAEWHRWEE